MYEWQFFLIIMSDTVINSFLPNAPSGCVFAKSFIVKPFFDDIAIARASDSASAQIMLDVGAKLLGHASLSTDAFSEIFEYLASDEETSPVIDIIEHLTIAKGVIILIFLLSHRNLSR